MAVAVPKSRTAPAPRPSRTTAPPRRRKAPARKPATKRAPAARPKLAVVAGRTAVAVRELPDSSLVVRMTHGRLWIGVLGVLLVGIVALNVATLSFAASAGKIDEQITALEQENSMLGGREAEHYSTARVRGGAAADALGRASDRASLRRLPPLFPPHRRPRLLAAGGAGREPRLPGDLPAD